MSSVDYLCISHNFLHKIYYLVKNPPDAIDENKMLYPSLSMKRLGEGGGGLTHLT